MSAIAKISSKIRPKAPHVEDVHNLPDQCKLYPEFRYMGSKRRLLPWIHEVIQMLDFESAWDPFSGSGCVSYLLKATNRRVVTSDCLNFPSTLGKALIANPGQTLDGRAIKQLLGKNRSGHNFIQNTFDGIFYTTEDLAFLDRVSGNLQRLENQNIKALAMGALLRSCLKKQPRGVFTISGDLSKYNDGRRDLLLSIEEHFLEQIEVFNRAVFKNGRTNRAFRGDVFQASIPNVDLVYLDPPYVPRSDDNCYIKRYHFLEGLSCYWQGMDIDYSTKVRKIRKMYTPFSYRKDAIDAFDRMFKRLSRKIIILSYSSNAYPDLDQLVSLLRKYKNDVRVFERAHRYHFGTHGNVERALTTEYLIVGK